MARVLRVDDKLLVYTWKTDCDCAFCGKHIAYVMCDYATITKVENVVEPVGNGDYVQHICTRVM